MLIRLFLFSPVLLLTLVACGGAEISPTPTSAPVSTPTPIPTPTATPTPSPPASIFQSSQILFVSKSGGDFSSIQEALDSIEDASAERPYTLIVDAGIYRESVGLKEWVNLQGISRNSVQIVAPGPLPTVTTADHSTLANLTLVSNDETTPFSGCILVAGGSPVIEDVTCKRHSNSQAVNSQIIRLVGGEPLLRNVRIEVSGTTNQEVRLINLEGPVNPTILGLETDNQMPLATTVTPIRGDTDFTGTAIVAFSFLRVRNFGGEQNNAGINNIGPGTIISISNFCEAWTCLRVRGPGTIRSYGDILLPAYAPTEGHDAGIIEPGRELQGELTSQGKIELSDTWLASLPQQRINGQFQIVGGRDLLQFQCTPDATIGKAVYVAGPDVVGVADSNSLSTMPAIGIVAAKPTTRQCLVRVDGPFYDSSAPFDSMGIYYLGSNGNIISQRPSDAHVQSLGWNINQKTLFIRPGPVEILEEE
ncbi:MAG: hypothetical protein V3U90_05980 [Dehalococcoidia bacterium]